jgi:polyhydroxybutyrate depolymerase
MPRKIRDVLHPYHEPDWTYQADIDSLLTLSYPQTILFIPIREFYMKKIVILIMLLILSITPVFGQIDSTRYVLDYDGLERSYELYVPDNVPDDAPLLIALHQFSSSARAMQLLTDLNTLADEMGLIVAYPETTGFGWNNGTGEIDRSYFGTDIENPDDLGFIQTLMDTLFLEYSMDPEQVYVVGGENGGLMATYMACQIPEKLAGMVSVGATMWEYQQGVCPDTPNAPVDVVYMMGTNDWFYPISGRNFQFNPENPERYTLSFKQTLEYWGERNGCNLDSIGTPDGETGVFYTDCETDVRTYFYGVEDGGSAWFGDYNVDPVGITTEAILEAFISGEHLANFPQQDISVLTDLAPPRSYRLYVPTGYNPDEPKPIVVALHGRPDSGIGFSVITQLHLTAERENFLVVYPDGLNLGWNSVIGFPEYKYEEWDDTEFLKDLVLNLSEQVNIDLNRVYATGFSNGGFMTQRLACDAYDFFAAYAVLGATFIPAFTPVCDSANPVPIMFMHGTDDVSIPWDGARSQMGVIDSLFFWVSYNDCNIEPREIELIPPQEEEPETFIAKIFYEDCAFGGDLWFYGVENGGHNWTGVPDIISEEIAGLVNTDVHASDVVWEFMSQYTLNDE